MVNPGQIAKATKVCYWTKPELYLAQAPEGRSQWLNRKRGGRGRELDTQIYYPHKYADVYVTP